MDRSEGSDEAQRPTPARQGMGKSSGSSPRRGRSEGSGSLSARADPQRPTPVREMMAPEALASGTGWEPPSRTFEHEGREWVVILVGQTLTGFPPDAGAPLMNLRFAPAEAPDQPERELLCVGRGLDALFDEELRHYLERARPFRGGSAPGSPG